MNVLDLCSGIGGFSLGFQWAGMTTIGFCEPDPKCQRVLKKHWPDVPIYDDIYELKGDDINGSVGLVCAGYPCQPYSIAGVRLGADDDRDLWPEVFRIVQEVRPDWFVGENVVGHVSMGLDTVLADLDSAGYQHQTFIIPACAIDAPHRRDRLFIIANTYSEGLEGRKKISDFERGPKLSFGPCDSLAISRRGWLPGTGLCGVDDGISNRVDRIKMLGNSLVPGIPEIIGRAILKVAA